MEKTGKSPIFLITTLTVVIALANLMLLLLAGPADISRIAPKNLRLVLAWCALIVALGVAIQVWLRNKPKYKTAKLLAYAFTVAVSLAAGLIVINLGLVAIHSR